METKCCMFYMFKHIIWMVTEISKTQVHAVRSANYMA